MKITPTMSNCTCIYSHNVAIVRSHTHTHTHTHTFTLSYFHVRLPHSIILDRLVFTQHVSHISSCREKISFLYYALKSGYSPTYTLEACTNCMTQIMRLKESKHNFVYFCEAADFSFIINVCSLHIRINIILHFSISQF